MLITCVAPYNLVCITIENHPSLSSNWGTLCVSYFNKSYPDIILLRGSLSWTSVWPSREIFSTFNKSDEKCWELFLTGPCPGPGLTLNNYSWLPQLNPTDWEMLEISPRCLYLCSYFTPLEINERWNTAVLFTASDCVRRGLYRDGYSIHMFWIWHQFVLFLPTLLPVRTGSQLTGCRDWTLEICILQLSSSSPSTSRSPDLR